MVKEQTNNMTSYEFFGGMSNDIMKLENDNGKIAYIDLKDFSVYPEETEDDADDIEDLFGYHGIAEKYDRPDNLQKQATDFATQDGWQRLIA